MARPEKHLTIFFFVMGVMVTQCVAKSYHRRLLILLRNMLTCLLFGKWPPRLAISLSNNNKRSIILQNITVSLAVLFVHNLSVGAAVALHCH
jgi:ABC-type uncharacterized transport system fused permease/ATPase subunit